MKISLKNFNKNNILSQSKNTNFKNKKVEIIHGLSLQKGKGWRFFINFRMTLIFGILSISCCILAILVLILFKITKQK
jgi:hypothetical protein